jgi:Lon protease-like protein
MSLLPVFPLGTVLFPGMPLPLHVFEERYRRLVRDLLAQPEPRRFGVVAIRRGREVGAGGVKALYATGCLAEVRQVAELADGRFALVAVGGGRFRLGPLDRSCPYLRAEPEPVAEEAGDPGAAAAAARAVRAAFPAYLAALARHGGAWGEGRAASGEGTAAGAATLPDDPVELSYRVASAMLIDLPDRQALLEARDAAARLAAERVLLGREIAMARSLSSAPAPGLRHARYHPN